MIKNVAVGFVVYNSDNLFLKRLLSLSNNNFIYLFDNTPDDPLLRNSVVNNPNIKYFTSGKNVGLGVGISTITSNAYFDGFKSMVFFDQDTYISNKTLEYIKLKFEKLKDFAAILFTNNSNLKTEKYENRDLIINSGSLFNLSILKILNWHNTNYFVDGVDYDFCLRAKKMGYKIICDFSTPDYDHETGQDDKSYFLLGIKLRLRAYKLNRILDTLGAYTKLILTSFYFFQFRLLFKFIYFFTLYCFGQILVRFLILFNVKQV